MASDKYPLRRESGQSVVDMTEQLRKNSAKNRLNRSNSYPVVAQAVKSETLANVIDQQMELQQHLKKHGRVNLDDLSAVEETVTRYLESCKAAGVVPGVSGLAAALGCSRQWLNRYASANKTASAKYLDSMRGLFSAVLEQAALTRTASEPVAIFLMKNNGCGMSDRMDMDMSVTNNGGAWYDDDSLSEEELKQRIMAYLGEDEATYETGEKPIET